MQITPMPGGPPRSTRCQAGIHIFSAPCSLLQPAIQPEVRTGFLKLHSLPGESQVLFLLYF